MIHRPDDLVRIKGQAGTYRIHQVNGDEVTMFGGPRRQWRTVKADVLRPATKREAADHQQAEQALRAAARAIKPARPVK